MVDDKALLDPADQFTSTYSGKEVVTIGGKWSDMEAYRFNSNSQPLYVMLDSDGNILKDSKGVEIPTSPANYHIDQYIKYLDSGIAAYKK